MKPDEQRIRDVLVDTIRLLCRTGVEYTRRLRVQGLLGITVDDEHVFLIHVDDYISQNCSDIDDRLRGIADECLPAGIGRNSSDVALASVHSGSHNASADFHSNSIYQRQLGAHTKYPNHLSLDQQTRNDVLTSVAMSEISSVIGASTEAQDLPSLQPLTQNCPNIPFRENNLPTVNSESSSESSDELTSSGNDAAAGLATDISQLSVPKDMEAENKNRPDVVKMETDLGESNTAVNVLPQDRELESGMALCTAADASRNQNIPSNFGDIDSIGDEDDDSEHTSESEEVADPSTVTQLLQYDPRALVGNVSTWPAGGLQQHNVSESAADTVAIQPAVLTGVVPTAGSHVSVYFQQQVDFLPLNSYSCFNIVGFRSLIKILYPSHSAHFLLAFQ